MKKSYLVSMLVALVSTVTLVSLVSCENQSSYSMTAPEDLQLPSPADQSSEPGGNRIGVIRLPQEQLRSGSLVGRIVYPPQGQSPFSGPGVTGKGTDPVYVYEDAVRMNESGAAMHFLESDIKVLRERVNINSAPDTMLQYLGSTAVDPSVDGSGYLFSGLDLDDFEVLVNEDPSIQRQLESAIAKANEPPSSFRWTREGLGRIDFGGEEINLPAELVASTVPTTAPAATTGLSIRTMSPTDEVWIIAQPDTPPSVNLIDDEPGTGSLMTMLPGTTTRVAVPLKHTEVTGSVAAFIASVNVQQQFENPYDGKIEAVYVFPLPDNAAVNGFLMTVGDRTIRGIIRKREEAEQIYTQARAQGYTASLLTQERPNIFTQKVANIEPGKKIDIDITYFNTLSYSDGWFEFAFPMVVGPRFNPSSVAAAGTGIGAAQRGQPGSTGQATEIQYLRPNERSGHDIGLTLSIEAGMPIESVESVSHQIDIAEESLSKIRVSLKDGDTIPNRDFVLRYKVAGGEARSGLVVQPDADGEGGYFAAMLVPPTDLTRLGRSPLEMVFVLDCSGSMSGTPLSQAKEAVRTALDRLQPGDSFQIIRFSENATALGSEPLEATPTNIQRGKNYLASLGSGGGTQMIEGIRAALGFAHDPERLRYVAFLTDGFIGNESEILAEIDAGLGDSRIFSFGVGTSTNRHLMEQMAKFGRGVVAYLNPGDESQPVMSLFMDRIQHAALSDVRLELPGALASEMYPSRLPDLYVGRPVVTLGRYEGKLDESNWGKSGAARMLGRTGGLTAEVAIAEPSFVGEDAGLDTIWARTKIASLNRGSITAKAASEREEYTQMVESLALNHNLMSAFTSFVAVDSSRVTEGSTGTSVGVPVPVPVGVAYETTVGTPGG